MGAALQDQLAQGGRRRTDRSGLAAMVVMTDEPVPDAVVSDVLALEGFVSGRSVTLR